MAEYHDNVIPFRPRQHVLLASEYITPQDATDVVALACCDGDDALSVVLLAPPSPTETLWEIRDPSEVERLARHLLQLARMMREANR